MSTTDIRKDCYAQVKRVLVTGANGFVGTALCKRLQTEGFEVLAGLRRSNTPFNNRNIRTIVIGDIDGQTNWARVLSGTDIVIHLAARVHVTAADQASEIETFRRVNVAGTKNLAESAIRAGVKRFVYISSVKVNGEENATAYAESKQPSPEDAYGISKMEAEQVLRTVADESKLEVVTLRPPLVYGPGVKANFLALMRLIDKQIPIPLKSVSNQRSFISLDNLVDSVHRCMLHPNASGKTYFVSDDQDLSTPALIRLLASAMDKKACLFACPTTLLRAAAAMVGRGRMVSRLLGSLTVDISKIKSELAWVPPLDVTSGILATAKWFKETKERRFVPTRPG